MHRRSTQPLTALSQLQSKDRPEKAISAPGSLAFEAWISALAILLSFLLASCGPNGQSGGFQGARPVQVSPPEIREVTLWDDCIGRFEALEQVELRPRVSGYIEEIHFRDGAEVEQGALLFTIDQRPFLSPVSD
jgi:multidrug efflux pump subunit AcrA (membrane-fusion protein)